MRNAFRKKGKLERMFQSFMNWTLKSSSDVQLLAIIAFLIAAYVYFGKTVGWW